MDERGVTVVSFTLAAQWTTSVPVGDGRDYLGDEVRVEEDDGGREGSLISIDLWSHGEHAGTYSGDWDDEIPLPDADWIVDAAIRAGIFIPALADRT